MWVAFADFFTAMAAMALVLYGVQHNKNVTLEGKQVAEDLFRLLQAKQLDVQFDRQRGSISIRETMLFEFREWTIKDPTLLDRLAAALREVATKSPHWRRNMILVVRGHTDAWPPAPTAPFKSNFQLSLWRAEAVQVRLEATGIGAPDFTVVAQGLGPSEPIVDNCKGVSPKPRPSCANVSDLRPPQELAPNRRIELRFGFFTGRTGEGQ